MNIAKATFRIKHKEIITTVHAYFNGLAWGDQPLLTSAFDMQYDHITSIVENNETDKQSVRSQTRQDFVKVFNKSTEDHLQA